MRTERTNGAPDDGASVVSYDGLSRRRQPQSQFTLHGQPAAGIGEDNGRTRHTWTQRWSKIVPRVCYIDLDPRFPFCSQARWGTVYTHTRYLIPLIFYNNTKLSNFLLRYVVSKLGLGLATEQTERK